jgi:hypothetical protein
MQTIVTIATIAFLSLMVVLGFLSVVGDLLERTVGVSPLMPVSDASLTDATPEANETASIGETVCTNYLSSRNACHCISQE